MTDDGETTPLRRLVVREAPSVQRLHAEQRKQVGRHPGPAHPLRLTGMRQRQRHAVEGRDVRETPTLASPLLDVPEGRPVLSKVLAGRLRPQHDQLVRGARKGRGRNSTVFNTLNITTLMLIASASVPAATTVKVRAPAHHPGTRRAGPGATARRDPSPRSRASARATAGRCRSCVARPHAPPRETSPPQSVPLSPRRDGTGSPPRAPLPAAASARASAGGREICRSMVCAPSPRGAARATSRRSTAPTVTAPPRAVAVRTE